MYVVHNKMRGTISIFGREQYNIHVACDADSHSHSVKWFIVLFTCQANKLAALPLPLCPGLDVNFWSLGVWEFGRSVPRKLEIDKVVQASQQLRSVLVKYRYKYLGPVPVQLYSK